MSRLKELIDELCPDGVEYKTIKSVCSNVMVPMRDRPKVFDGTIPWCRIEDIEGCFLNTSLSNHFVSEAVIEKMRLRVFPEGTVVCSCSASLGVYAITTQPLVMNQTFIGLVPGQNIEGKYLLYCMMTMTGKLQSRATTGTISYVSRKSFEQLSIPVPPVEVQREVVRILDSFQELDDALTAEIGAREKQFETHRDEFFDEQLAAYCPDGLTHRTLGDIGPVCMCKRVFKKQTTATGEVPFYKIGTFGKEPDAYISYELYQDYKSKYSFPNKGDVIISCSGTLGRTVIYDGKPAYYQDSNLAWISNNEKVIFNKYLFYYYQIVKWPESKGGTIGRLYIKDIAAIRIPIPPIDVQQDIVIRLDAMQSLIDELRSERDARRRQFVHYRDKLLAFPERASQP